MKNTKIKTFIYILITIISLLAATIYFLSRERAIIVMQTEEYLSEHSIFEDIYFSSNNEYMQRVIPYKGEDYETYHAYIPSTPEKALRIYYSYCSKILFNGIELSSGEVLPTIEPEIPYLVQAVGWNHEIIEENYITFYFSGTLPAIYINTESRSMEQINSDKEIREKASYALYTKDGILDSVGQCTIKGRGNSSWSSSQKPYNLNLSSSSPLLGMDSTADWALLRNSKSDFPQLKNKVAFDLARKLGQNFAPQSEFVNVYLNGQYNGLYLLAQRINVNDGTIKISNLEEANKLENSSLESLEIYNDTTPEGWQEQGVLLANNPHDITGGYLLEFDARCDNETSYFTTDHQEVAIKSPSIASKEQVSYIAGLIREAETTIFNDNGINTITGKSTFEYLDLDSWSKMFLLQDYFVQWDVEYSSFYLYKQKQDPLLYAGPIWDFDLSCGKMYFGDYPLLSQHLLWAGEVKGNWLRQLYRDDEFAEYTKQQYLNELSPAITELLTSEYSDIVAPLASASKMSAILWNKEDTYAEATVDLFNWLSNRQQFLDNYYQNPDNYCKVTFSFSWAPVPYYVEKNTALNFLPCDAYGEKDKNGSIYGYEDILGWIDENGNEVSAEDIISEDVVYYPVYQAIEEN